jgi:hypothetical protein
MSNAVALLRSFTVAESSAIASVQVEDNQAMIAFQSNPDKVYTFDASDSFIQELEEILNQNPIQGLGSLVAAARKSGDLQDVTV